MYEVTAEGLVGFAGEDAQDADFVLGGVEGLVFVAGGGGGFSE